LARITARDGRRIGSRSRIPASAVRREAEEDWSR
jgi:hypothetical protein